MSALKRHWENAFSGKQMDTVQEDTLVVSATEIIVDNQHYRPLLLQRRRPRLTEEDFRKAKGMPPGEVVLLERNVVG